MPRGLPFYYQCEPVAAQAALASSSWSRARRACSACLRVTHQPGGVVVAEHQALERERQLWASRSAPKSPSVTAVPATVATNSSQSCWLRTTASRIGPGWSSNSADAVTKMQPPCRPGLPVEPPVEEGADPRLSPRRGQRGPDDDVGEPLARPLERLELHGFLGLEVRQQAASAHPRVLGVADGQAGEADLGGDRDGSVEDRRPCLLARYPLTIARLGHLVKPVSLVSRSPWLTHGQPSGISVDQDNLDGPRRPRPTRTQ